MFALCGPHSPSELYGEEKMLLFLTKNESRFLDLLVCGLVAIPTEQIRIPIKIHKTVISRVDLFEFEILLCLSGKLFENSVVRRIS
jgi:hypothetical protein